MLLQPYTPSTPCLIHHSSVRGAQLKSSRPGVFDPCDVLMRSLTPWNMFSTSPSTVSFSPDDWAPSVSTTLGHSALALEGFIHLSPAAGSGCEREQFVAIMAASIQTASSSYCCSCGAEPPAVSRPEGQPASVAHTHKNKQKEGGEWKSIPH